MSLRGDWNYPTIVKAGAGRIAELPSHCLAIGIRRPLVVTDPGLREQPFVGTLRERLHAAGLPSGLFTELRPNPVGKNVDDGVAAYRAGGHDGVVAVGGGSALDVAKAIALLSGQSRPLFDFEDVGDNWLRVDPDGVAPCIAIPTTAGTGSEVGRASVITDESVRAKKIIFHPRMLPRLVILDPELTFGLPPFFTAATGMDALSHCLEAYSAPGYHPLAAGIALEGIRLVHETLELAHREPRNEEARLRMLTASSMGATAFQRGLGAMHALAHPLGALFDAHHGALNAVLMPYVLIANRPAIEDRITAAARYLDLARPSFDGFLERVLELRDRLGLPHTLAGLGVDASCRDRIGELAVADASAGSNPIAFSAAQYQAIFDRALSGALESP